VRLSRRRRGSVARRNLPLQLVRGVPQLHRVQVVQVPEKRA
jgi:hypothetical protein